MTDPTVRSREAAPVAAQKAGGILHGLLVTYRRPRELSLMLHGLDEQHRKLDRLLVVDNSPGPETRRILGGYRAGPIQYLPAPENLGPAGGIALGMTHLLRSADDHDWMVVLDDDDPPRSPAVIADLERFAHAMRVRDAATGGVGLRGARFDWKRGRAVPPRDEELASEEVAVDYIGGNKFAFYLVEAVRRVGPFRPDLFFGLDDLEFGLRMRRAGYSLYAEGPPWRERRAELGHLGVGRRPASTVEEPSWRRYYSLRNAIYILRLHGRPLTAARLTVVSGLGKPLANLVVHPRQAARALALNWWACRDAWQGRTGRTIDPA